MADIKIQLVSRSNKKILGEYSNKTAEFLKNTLNIKNKRMISIFSSKKSKNELFKINITNDDKLIGILNLYTKKRYINTQCLNIWLQIASIIFLVFGCIWINKSRRLANQNKTQLYCNYIDDINGKCIFKTNSLPYGYNYDNSIQIPINNVPLYNLFNQNQMSTTAGINNWLNIIPNSKLQHHEQQEGINIQNNNDSIRIGIASNFNSKIGVGFKNNQYYYHAQKNKSYENTAGNLVIFNNQSVRNIKAFVCISILSNEKGTKDLPYSCYDIQKYNNDLNNGVQTIYNASEHSYKVYCDMKSGGQTIILRIDGNKNTFNYDSELWTNKDTLNEFKANILFNEHKNRGFYEINANKIKVSFYNQNYFDEDNEVSQPSNKICFNQNKTANNLNKILLLNKKSEINCQAINKQNCDEQFYDYDEYKISIFNWCKIGIISIFLYFVIMVQFFIMNDYFDKVDLNNFEKLNQDDINSLITNNNELNNLNRSWQVGLCDNKFYNSSNDLCENIIRLLFIFRGCYDDKSFQTSSNIQVKKDGLGFFRSLFCQDFLTRQLYVKYNNINENYCASGLIGCILPCCSSLQIKYDIYAYNNLNKTKNIINEHKNNVDEEDKTLQNESSEIKVENN